MTLTPFVMEEDRADIRAALIAMSIWNVQIAKNTKKGESPKYRELYEFLIQWGDEPDPKPQRSSEDQFESVVDAFQSMGFRPVDRANRGPDVDDMGRQITSSQVNNT